MSRRRRLGMGLMFYPRGGSAQVARYLSGALVECGWEVVLASGSLGARGEPTHAATFFEGLKVEAVDYTPALERYLRGEDHLAGPVPFHGSFEDRDGVPDPVFASLSAEQVEAQVSAWEGVFDRAGFDQVDVLHRHHLTPMHDAAARVAPNRGIVTHLHGTELRMLDRIARLDTAASAPGTDLDRPGADVDVRAFPADRRLSAYRFRRECAARLRASAHKSGCIAGLSSLQAAEAVRLLGVSSGLIEVVPNGVDTDRFHRSVLSRDDKLTLVRKWLVDDPQGWDESGLAGSIRYPPEALDAFVDDTGELLPILLFVGRYVGFKRVPLLVRAYERARPRFESPAPLVIWGGSPGEWEGEHPYAVVRDLAVDGVFLTGWRGHDDLPLGLSCADVFVAPSVDEPFGLVFLEAMSCGLPVVATATGGPLSFVNTVAGEPNGWLVPPDDIDALADALVQAVNDPDTRSERADNARRQIRRNYSWHAVAERFDALYTDLLDGKLP